MDTPSFILQKFAEFYEEEATSIKPPPSIEQREFGFLLFKENIMVRHKVFATAEDLAAFMKEIVPSHAYYSTAYYETPDAKMEEKGWLGADLYFDIDADHIVTKCGKVHDTWGCKECGFAGRGVAPESCPMCGSNRFDDKTWPCEVCLESAKEETIKLVDILTEDFGFSSDEVDVSFSGHRGYHAHVEDEAIHGLDSVARKEMVDYITGTGLNSSFQGLEESRSGRSRIMRGPDLDDLGWRGRLARGTRELLLSVTEEELRSMGVDGRIAKEVMSKREAISESWSKHGPWGLVKGLSAEKWSAMLRRASESQSVKIDTVVTTDIHRLIRLPNSLHGKTGLIKVPFRTDGIEEFDPLRSAVAFKKGDVTVYVGEAPQFRLGEERFGPFKEQKVDLPMAAALFLLCKGAAKVVD